MEKRKSFYLLAPYFINSFLTKDIGLIPYIMQKYKGYRAVYATYRPTFGYVSWPMMEQFSETIKFDFIEPSFEYHPDTVQSTIWGNHFYDCQNDLERYIAKKAKDIDVLFIFGFYQFYYNAIRTYKQLNPNGKVYLKLDANRYWVNKTHVNDAFKQFLDNCDLITSEVLAPYIAEKWQVPVHYIPNGYYDLNESSNSLEETYSFSDKEDIIFTAARLGHPSKATPVLLEAFKFAAPVLPKSWSLVLAGGIEPDFTSYIENFTKQNPEISKRIHFLGLINDKEELKNWYKKAKIFAFPSAVEGYANVLAEAKVHGCYLLASDIDCNRDAVSSYEQRAIQHKESPTSSRHLDYGSLHQVGSSMDMAQKMIEICHNQQLLEQVCYATQKDAQEHFDWVKLCHVIHEHLY